MLILSRKLNEKICIGNDITVTVTSVRGDKVLLGIEAPKHMQVHRLEVQEEIERIEKDERNQ